MTIVMKYGNDRRRSMMNKWLMKEERRKKRNEEDNWIEILCNNIFFEN